MKLKIPGSSGRFLGLGLSLWEEVREKIGEIYDKYNKYINKRSIKDQNERIKSRARVVLKIKLRRGSRG